MNIVARILMLSLMAVVNVVSASETHASLQGRTARQSFNLRELDVQPEDSRCPVPLRECAIVPNANSGLRVALSKRSIIKRNWECSNLQTDVNSCGSCDNDCLELPNVSRAKCDSGSCKIITCQSGLHPQVIINHTSGARGMVCA